MNKTSWQYNALELIPDKTEFAPNENVTLRINTNREQSTVLLFVKPTNGVAAGKPQVLRLNGKSTEVQIPVELRDMPNFFVEALTVTDGKIETEIREIVVPPQKKVLNVEVKPSAETYKPGGKAKADLIVTDLDGKPVTGQIAVTIYDKSVEYISGGSNVGDIKEFFWKWQRHHHPQSFTNLQRYWERFTERDKPQMEQLGLFGYMEASDSYTSGIQTRSSRNSGMAMGGYGGDMMVMADAEMPESSIAMDMAVPAAEMPMAPRLQIVAKSEAGIDTGGALVEPTVRTNFADTALWIGALETDENGKAQIELDMPESLTTWKINVWTMAFGTRVGQGSAEVITRKDFMIRMQTPRFLIEKDRAVFSANVHNYLAEEKEAKVSLEITNREPGTASPIRMVAETQVPTERQRTQTVKIPANGEARVNWYVEAKLAGEAAITMKALTDEESDAMQKTLPVYVHGMLKQDSYSAFIAPQETSATIAMNVPAERKPEQTKLTVKVAPTLAATMIDALPYLVDYPYGCTEQTLNKFLPTVIVRKVLGSIPATQSPALGQRQISNREPGTVSPDSLNPEEVDDMVRTGITKLTNMQNPDGGWGWFSGYGERSSAHLTALVLHGLQIAKSCNVNVPDEVFNRGRDWLAKYQDRQIVLLKNASVPDKEEKKLEWKSRADENDAFVFMVLAETFMYGMRMVDSSTADMLEFLNRDLGKLSPYGVAMVGIGESGLPGTHALSSPYIKILEQYLVQDEENQTAYLNLNNYAGWCWWYWYGSEFETQAYYLKLLMRSNAKSPIAPRLVKYLLNNRKHATYWNSTRDTAIVIEAFAEYLEKTGEGKPDAEVEILVDGEVKKTIAFTPENFLTVDSTLVLEKEQLSTGKHQIDIRKKGESPLYISAYLENFTLEDPIAKAGLEVKVERRIYKLTRDESSSTAVAGNRGQAVNIKTEKYKRELLTNDANVESGDLLEVELLIESKNDYESLLIEDWKAAGCEPVDVRSGYNGNELGAYVEFRDERVVFFVYRLLRGKHSLTYRLRAEVPGKFSVLPTRIEAMYAPELKGNSDEDKVNVTE